MAALHRDALPQQLKWFMSTCDVDFAVKCMISYLWCEFMSIRLPNFSWSMIVYWFLRFMKPNHRTSVRLLYTYKCAHNQACAWQCATGGYMIYMVCYMLYSSALSIAAMISGNDPLWQLIAWLLKGMNWQFLCTDFCISTFFDMKILCYNFISKTSLKFE